MPNRPLDKDDTAGTDWSVIRGAAVGNDGDREAFACIYSPVARAYYCARWGRGPLAATVDDAVQEVFAECFRLQGPLERVKPSRRHATFRRFFCGILRNIARRFERSHHGRREVQPESTGQLLRVRADDAHLSQVLDRAWAGLLLQQALRRADAQACDKGEAAQRRIELLRLHFRDDLPLREIALRWGVPRATIYQQFRTARREFVAALREVIKERGLEPDEVREELARLYELVRKNDSQS